MQIRAIIETNSILQTIFCTDYFVILPLITLYCKNVVGHNVYCDRLKYVFKLNDLNSKRVFRRCSFNADTKRKFNYVKGLINRLR